MPAADVKWLGTETNLGTAAGYAPAQVPVTDDWIWFDKAGAALTAGWDQHLVAPGQLIVTKDCTIALGDASNYLEYGIIQALRFEGQAAANNKLKSAGIYDCHILDCLQLSIDSTILNLYFQKGTASFLKTGGGAITAAYIGQKDNARTDVAATFASTVTITDLHMFGGVVETNAVITRGHVSNGVLTHKGSAAISTLIVSGRGKVIYEASVAPTYMVIGPDAEVSFTTNAGPVTLGRVTMFNGSKLDLRNGQANIEFHATYGYTAYGFAFPYLDEGVRHTTVGI